MYRQSSAKVGVTVWVAYRKGRPLWGAPPYHGPRGPAFASDRVLRGETGEGATHIAFTEALEGPIA